MIRLKNTLHRLRQSWNKRRQNGRDQFFLLLFRLPADHGSLSQGRVQDLLPDSKAGRGYLQKFIDVDEIETLFQAHLLRGRQSQGFIGAGGTRVGQFLCLADVQLDVLGLGALSDHHTGIDFHAGSDEERASLLRIEQAVCDGFSGLECDQGTLFAVV